MQALESLQNDTEFEYKTVRMADLHPRYADPYTTDDEQYTPPQVYQVPTNAEQMIQQFNELFRGQENQD